MQLIFNRSPSNFLKNAQAWMRDLMHICLNSVTFSINIISMQIIEI